MFPLNFLLLFLVEIWVKYFCGFGFLKKRIIVFILWAKVKWFGFAKKIKWLFLYFLKRVIITSQECPNRKKTRKRIGKLSYHKHGQRNTKLFTIKRLKKEDFIEKVEVDKRRSIERWMEFFWRATIHTIVFNIITSHEIIYEEIKYWRIHAHPRWRHK